VELFQVLAIYWKRWRKSDSKFTYHEGTIFRAKE